MQNPPTEAQTVPVKERIFSSAEQHTPADESPPEEPDCTALSPLHDVQQTTEMDNIESVEAMIDSAMRSSSRASSSVSNSFSDALLKQFDTRSAVVMTDEIGLDDIPATSGNGEHGVQWSIGGVSVSTDNRMSYEEVQSTSDSVFVEADELEGESPVRAHSYRIAMSKQQQLHPQRSSSSNHHASKMLSPINEGKS